MLCGGLLQCCEWWGGILFPGRVGALSQQIATSIIIHLTRVSRHRLPSIWTPPVPCSSNTDRVSPDFWQFRTRYRVLVVPISTHMLYLPSCCCCPWQAMPLGFAWSLSVYRWRYSQELRARIKAIGKKSEAVKRNPKPQIYRHHPSALLQHTNQTDIHVHIPMLPPQIRSNIKVGIAGAVQLPLKVE